MGALSDGHEVDVEALERIFEAGVGHRGPEVADQGVWVYGQKWLLA